MRNFKDIFPSGKKLEPKDKEDFLKSIMTLSNEYNILMKSALDGINVELQKEEFLKKAKELASTITKSEVKDLKEIYAKVNEYNENRIMNEDVAMFFIIELSRKIDEGNEAIKRIR